MIIVQSRAKENKVGRLDTKHIKILQIDTMSQQYSLRWNNHQPNFISMFTTLLNTKTLVDVTLAAEGKHLQAHKIVLSACSTYFQALFVDNPSQHPIVILKDVTFDDLRTMVDFMYCGEVNVTEEQLPKVLDTAKHLKIKGLTEMPETTSLTRAQGAEPADGDARHSASPGSPNNKRRRYGIRRKSSTGSPSLSAPEERADAHEPPRDSVTLSSLPQRRRDFDDGQHQNADPHINVEPLPMDAGAAGLPQGAQWSMMDSYPRYSNACLGLPHEPGMYMGGAVHGLEGELGEYGAPGPSPGPSCAPEPPAPDQPPPPPKRRRATNPQSEENFQRALEAVRFGGIGFCKAARMFGVNNRTLWLEYKKKGYPNNRPSIKSRIKQSPSVRLRRSKYFKRQSRVQPEERVRRQASEPAPAPAPPALRKHDSYPQYTGQSSRGRALQQQVGSLLIRAVACAERPAASTSFGDAPRASHTPAVRSGPPLSCNFCWNTVDECGRILRRKTQYHCPECRTNLCIVPCFHEYHEGPDEPAAAT